MNPSCSALLWWAWRLRYGASISCMPAFACRCPRRGQPGCRSSAVVCSSLRLAWSRSPALLAWVLSAWPWHDCSQNACVGKHWLAISTAAGICVAVLAFTIAAFTVLSGIGLGWITGQGGAATIRSWLSISTDIGVTSGFIGMMLGLITPEAILTVTRAVGVLAAAAFMVRMIFATYRGVMHPVGGSAYPPWSWLSCFQWCTLVYPVGYFPLAAWANRLFFRYAVMIYSAVMSFVVLPRGLGLPPGPILQIYLSAAVGLWAVLVTIGWVALRLYGAVNQTRQP